MITIETKVDWLQHMINQKKKAIQEWQIIACRTNICDNMGRNPIDKLSHEIKIAQELIDMCSVGHASTRCGIAVNGLRYAVVIFNGFKTLN